MVEKKKDLVLLSEIALAVGVNKSKLVYYEQLGLIKSSAVVGKKKIKLYEPTETTARVNAILQLRKKHMSLPKIKVQLENKK